MPEGVSDETKTDTANRKLAKLYKVMRNPDITLGRMGSL